MEKVECWIVYCEGRRRGKKKLGKTTHIQCWEEWNLHPHIRNTRNKKGHIKMTTSTKDQLILYIVEIDELVIPHVYTPKKICKLTKSCLEN
jgi:hypothetical protein